MVCEPLVALLPVQPPLAVHELALVEDQVSTAVPPDCTEAGLADSETVGAAAWLALVTATATVLLIEPPVPVQASAKFVAAERALVALEPDTPSVPLQPPDAVQLLALAADHVSVVLDPDVTDVGEAENVRVGAAAGGELVAGGLVAVVDPAPLETL
jgi:hypothetical protein